MSTNSTSFNGGAKSRLRTYDIFVVAIGANSCVCSAFGENRIAPFGGKLSAGIVLIGNGNCLNIRGEAEALGTENGVGVQKSAAVGTGVVCQMLGVGFTAWRDGETLFAEHIIGLELCAAMSAATLVFHLHVGHIITLSDGTNRSCVQYIPDRGEKQGT